jgi:hypothetical protein
MAAFLYRHLPGGGADYMVRGVSCKPKSSNV